MVHCLKAAATPISAQLGRPTRETSSHGGSSPGSSWEAPSNFHRTHCDGVFGKQAVSEWSSSAGRQVCQQSFKAALGPYAFEWRLMAVLRTLVVAAGE